MKIAEELRPDGSTRYRVQHKDPARPGRYTTRRFDSKPDAAEFVRRAALGLNDAIAWADEQKGGVSFRGQAGRTFLAYATDFIDAQTDVKERTRKMAHARLRTIALMGSFAELPMGAISNTDLKTLKRDLSAFEIGRGTLLKSRTKNGMLDTVFAVIRSAVAANDIPRDVTMGITKFRVEDAKPTCPLTVPEFDSIMVHVAPERRAMFRVLLDSGMRISEALSLTWDDIRETAHGIYEIRVWQENATHGKSGNAQRVTTIPADTFKLLQRSEGAQVFPLSYHSFAAEWRRAVQRAQSPAHAKEFPVLVKSPTIHDLRHTHAGFLITECGMNLALVAERLGHRDIGITHKYYGRLVTQQAHELGVLVAQKIPRGTVV